MLPDVIREAALLLAEARRTGVPLDRLPDHAIPADAEDAFAIQQAISRLADDDAVGFKAALNAQFGVLYAGLLRSRVHPDQAVIASEGMTMIGVEAEIAFRFDRDVPPRAEAYAPEEIAALVSALPAIETLDTRFRDFDGTSVIAKAADFMSNGCFVAGSPRSDWRSLDLSAIEVILRIDGVERVRHRGGHPSVDPLLPAIALANRLRLTNGIAAGTIVTTGTYTGTIFVARDSLIEVTFAGLGSVSCRFAANAP